MGVIGSKFSTNFIRKSFSETFSQSFSLESLNSNIGNLNIISLGFIIIRRYKISLYKWFKKNIRESCHRRKFLKFNAIYMPISNLLIILLFCYLEGYWQALLFLIWRDEKRHKWTVWRRVVIMTYKFSTIFFSEPQVLFLYKLRTASS